MDAHHGHEKAGHVLRARHAPQLLQGFGIPTDSYENDDIFPGTSQPFHRLNHNPPGSDIDGRGWFPAVIIEVAYHLILQLILMQNFRDSDGADDAGPEYDNFAASPLYLPGKFRKITTAKSHFPLLLFLFTFS